MHTGSDVTERQTQSQTTEIERERDQRVALPLVISVRVQIKLFIRVKCETGVRKSSPKNLRPPCGRKSDFYAQKILLRGSKKWCPGPVKVTFPLRIFAGIINLICTRTREARKRYVAPRLCDVSNTRLALSLALGGRIDCMRADAQAP